MGQYQSRKTQVMTDVRAVKLGKMSVASAVKNAAMCGAFEARSQALEAIRNAGFDFSTVRELENAICNVPIMELLGWTTKKAVRPPRMASSGG